MTSTAGLTGAGLAPEMATTLGVTRGSDKTGEGLDPSVVLGITAKP